MVRDRRRRASSISRAFYAAYRADGHGRAAHDPAMMVALLLYAYAIGERSSRRIERRCVEDVATRVICANQTPDHTTIARFRQRHEAALAGLFGEVLALCAEAGLVEVGVIAVDGTKVHANASQHATRDYEQIAREILEEAGAVDAAEDERFGERRGDELPPELVDRAGPARLAARGQAPPRRAARRGGAADPALATGAAGGGEAPARGRAPGRVPGERRLRGLPGARADEGRPPLRPPPNPLRAARRRRPGRSTSPTPTRATSRRRAAGCRATTPKPSATSTRSSIAAEVTVDSPDFGHLEPMIAAAERELEAAGVSETPEVVLADAGYWHHDQMDELAGRGTTVLIPPDAGKRKGARPGWDGGRYAFMRRVLATDAGRDALRQTPRHDRADLRRHQVQPPDRPLLTPRQSRLPVRMAPDHRHPQPPQAPHRPDRRRGPLTGAVRRLRRRHRRRSRSSREAAGLYATATAQSGSALGHSLSRRADSNRLTHALQERCSTS